jgi:putative two-component system response regulator
MRVLLVDDDHISLELLENVLSDTSHEVSLAMNGDQALEMLAEREHHVVITDWNMPGMSGVDLVKQIRERYSGNYTYIMVLTSRDGMDDVVCGLEAGADDYITKPFNPTELLMRLRTGERIINSQTRDMTIFALAKLTESRDPETGEHLDRIRSYCRALATTCQERGVYADEIRGGFIDTLYATSPLHDIGKVGIPDSILLKPGSLTAHEYEIMQRHTVIGYNTLRAAADECPGLGYLQMACDIARSHHERFDGTGYPDGTSGLAIPLSARLTSIADVYDALTSRRVYKDAFSPEVANSIIVDGRDTYFDPALVDVFVQIADQFATIRGATPDTETVMA